MSRGYGKYRSRGNSHNTSFQFDSLCKENSNKPSASRSAGTVGKWGITSFTSIRLSRESENEADTVAAIPRPKKFFKSRNSSDSSDAPSTGSYIHDQRSGGVGSTTDYVVKAAQSGSNKRAKHSYDASPVKHTRKKFFSSKNKPEKTVLSSSNSQTGQTKPPIVLRICRGKSQLVSDSEDSESTPTPSSTPSTSFGGGGHFSPPMVTVPATTPPTSTVQVQIAPNARITRATRRSMQQDLSYVGSPTSGDTVEQSLSALFSSPRQDDSEPQYIPAEKYELERKAMYANLLGTSPPATIQIQQEVHISTIEQQEESEDVKEEAAEDYDEENITMQDVSNGVQQDTHTIPMEENEDESNDYDNCTKSEATSYHTTEDGIFVHTEPLDEEKELDPDYPSYDNDVKEEEEEDVQMETPVSIQQSENAPEPQIIEQPAETTTGKPKAVPEWCTDDGDSDSNSNSTAPEALVVKPVESPKIQQLTTTRTTRSSARKPSFTATIEEHKEEILDKILEKPPPEAQSPVKLVISKKKGSIFKSRALGPDGGAAAGRNKRRALYRHKWTTGIDEPSSSSTMADDDNAKGAVASGSGVSSTNPASISSPSDRISGDSDSANFHNAPLLKVVKDASGAVISGGSHASGSAGASDGSGVFDDNDITTVKCSKNDKGFYTVVRNVKKAHQIQEIGEFQEFNDDVDYILDALQDNNPISTRCLSAITLASKCMTPAFRMHVRAHGTVAKFFKALHDSTKDQSLGLCTATVMFVLSQDRLNMDLDRDCLELMLSLLESDVSYQQALDVCGLSSAQLDKNKRRVRELCAEIQSHGHAMHLNLDNITVGQLAMETLLSLTSKRAGEWFKEELRELGGLEHIMKTICECCRQVSDYVVSWTDVLLDKLRKVDRCLRVLENVTHNNEENQTYLLKYNNGVLLDTLVKLYRLCDSEIPLYPVTDITDKESAGSVIREALLVSLKVLINLTHHFKKKSQGSVLIGEQPGIIDASLHLLLQIPLYIPEQKKFELGVLVLMLLINLIQENDANKKLLIHAKAPAEIESEFQCDKSAVEALIAQFYLWVDYARIAEKRTDAILDGEKDGEVTTQPKSNEEFIEETVAKLLQKAGTHMEFTFLASYLVLLLGYLIMENEDYQGVVRQFLRNNNFATMVELLNKFFSFMNLTSSTEASSVCAIKATEKVIKFLEGCDKPKCDNEDSESSRHNSEGLELSFSITH